MPTLTTQFTYTLSTPLHIPPHPRHSPSALLTLAHNTALSLVHDHAFMMHLNPYIASFRPLDPAGGDEPVDYVRMADEFNESTSFQTHSFRSSRPRRTRVAGLEDVDGTSAAERTDGAGRTNDALGARDAVGEVKQYVILDKLPVMFGYTNELTYRSALVNTVEGMDSWTDPGSGVEVRGAWVVKRLPGSRVTNGRESTREERERAPKGEGAEFKNEEEGEEQVVLYERVDTKCNWFLSMYIKASLASSHGRTHKRFEEEWRRRVREELMREEEEAKMGRLRSRDPSQGSSRPQRGGER